MAGEFGLVTVDRSRLENLAEGGSRRARGVLGAIRKLSFQLSGAQLGITVTSLIVGYIAEPTIGRLIEPLLVAAGFPEGSSLAVAIAIALAFATAAEMVVGELIPKNAAIADPLKVSMTVGPFLRATNAALKPVILLLNNTANLTVRLLGIEPQEELTSVRSLEELQRLIYTSRQEGTLPEEEFSLLSRSISLTGKTAADALIPRTSMQVIDRDATLADLARLALETGYSRLPVIGEDMDDVVGVAHVKDSYRVPPDDRASVGVSEITQPMFVVPESRDLEPLLVEMRREAKHIAVVVDEYGGTAGIITLEDILEEIVGEIEDEHDRSAAMRLTRPPDGVFVVSGMLHPDEVRDATGFDMPEGDYETLAGFLLSVLDHIPEQGEHAYHDGWEFKVVEMEGRRISQVLVVAPPEGFDAEEQP